MITVGYKARAKMPRRDRKAHAVGQHYSLSLCGHVYVSKAGRYEQLAEAFKRDPDACGWCKRRL